MLLTPTMSSHRNQRGRGRAKANSLFLAGKVLLQDKADNEIDVPHTA